MTRDEALDKANAIVAAWLADPPKNGRGYIEDGYKAGSIEQRTDAVIKLAEFLWDVAPETKLAAPLPSPTLFGWAIDGSGGDPTRGQYTAAKSVLSSIQASGRPVPTVEIDALNALVGAYEATAPQAK